MPFSQPDIDQDETDEVVDTLRSGWITTGPKTRQFKAEFAATLGAKHAIAVNSCTGGLHVALAAAGIGPGNVVVHLGATPIIVDVEPDTLNIAPQGPEAAVTPRTKAVIPVHLYGHPCDTDRISEIAGTYFVDISATLETKPRAVEAYRETFQGEVKPFPHPRSPEAVHIYAHMPNRVALPLACRPLKHLFWLESWSRG